MKYRVIAKFDNETRIDEDDKMYSLLGHTEAEWIEIFEEVLGFDEHQAKSTLSRTMNSKNYGCYESLVYIRTAWERLQERKSKMTREEAVKIMDSNPSFSGAAWIARFEALGLIKFEEEKKERVVPRFESKSQMTREEAYNKLLSIGCEVRYGAKGQGDVIKALEALGLLKFEEKPPMVVRFDTKAYPNGLVIMLDGKVISP